MNLNELPDMSAAYKQVQEKKNNDGNLANNAVPYDKVTKADIITGAKGKDEQGGKKKPKGHDCAKLVKYEGKEYTVIPEAHTLLEDGTVTHYDIEDDEYIYENVPVGDLEILEEGHHEHFANYDKNAEVLGENRAAMGRIAREYKKNKEEEGMKKRLADHADKMKNDPEYAAKRRAHAQVHQKKEAFAFSEADFAELETLGEEIDSLTDEQLVDVMEDIILEMAQDDQDLIEICEHLEEVEILSEVTSPAAVNAARLKASSEKAPEKGPSRMDRLKGAAKKAGSQLKAGAQKAGAAAKKGIKAAGKSAVSNAGKAVGTFQGSREAARIKAKRTSMQNTPAKKKSSDDDGTGGKLDGVLDSIRKSKGTGSSSSSSSDSGSSSSGGGESSSSSSSAPAKKPSLLRRAAGAIGRGLKKAVGKTARAVSSGSGKLANRLGEDYDQIAHLYESGLFSIQEIENVIEEGYKEIDQPKKNKMFRRAGNLSRDALQGGDKGTEAHKKSGKIVKQLNKLNQENK